MAHAREVLEGWLASLRNSLCIQARHAMQGREADAEDVVQDALAALRPYLEVDQPLESLGALARGILRRRIASYWRAELRRRRNSQPLDDVEAWLQATAWSHGWAGPVLDELEKHGLLASLTPPQATVYAGLRAGQEPGEIAAALGMTRQYVEEIEVAIIKKGRTIAWRHPALREAYERERERERERAARALTFPPCSTSPASPSSASTATAR